MRLFIVPLLLCCAPVFAEERRRIIEPRPDSWRAHFCGMCSAVPRGDGYRVWLTARRDEHSPYTIGYVDLNSRLEYVGESDGPILEPTKEGFDKDGCLMPMVIDCGDHLRMYYVADGETRYNWDLNHLPMLARSWDDGQTWTKEPVPIITCEGGEESIGTHHVRREADGWHMIYTSVIGRAPKERRYRLRFAESTNGVKWHKPANNIALDIPDRTCGRPCVWRDGDRYLMTFCFSGGGVQYRVRYAESRDGKHFQDRGQVLDVSPSGWDSQMVTYAWVLPDRQRMLYSGNQWGSTGIGIAPLHIATK